jgi:hypothetical protein
MIERPSICLFCDISFIINFCNGANSRHMAVNQLYCFNRYILSLNLQLYDIMLLLGSAHFILQMFHTIVKLI